MGGGGAGQEANIAWTLSTSHTSFCTSACKHRHNEVVEVEQRKGWGHLERQVEGGGGGEQERGEDHPFMEGVWEKSIQH